MEPSTSAALMACRTPTRAHSAIPKTEMPSRWWPIISRLMRPSSDSARSKIRYAARQGSAASLERTARAKMMAALVAETSWSRTMARSRRVRRMWRTGRNENAPRITL